jgi:hypothetical protein
MPDKKQARISVSTIKLDTNLRCERVYPVEDEKSRQKMLTDLKTVGIKLSREQAIDLATILLVAAKEWAEIDLTAWRSHKRSSDGTYQLTVTTKLTNVGNDEEGMPE